ncbi:MAG TPA: HlyD family efflux transporter periplasmic adaptor subunit, partial [Prolixibacteraceae bacterium]|nr:HlyD family efflux transporter periplasmic adaptor subunit [Prolixibacteraceae bacterium]
MSISKNKYIWISGAIILLIAVTLIARTTVSSDKLHTVKPGPFELTISAKGEIQGKNAVVIGLPDELKRRDLRIYQLKLEDLVQEGTMVKKGEWVATLDGAAITERMQNNKQDLDRQRAELNDAKIDSAIQLTKLREELNEFKYDLEYQKIELEQAKFESPAYQRKQQMAFNKTLRQMDKKQRDYELKRLDLKTKTRRIEERFERHEKLDKLYKDAMAATRVKAPKEGMVMYAKQWNGQKLKVGDNVSMWMPTIATLPDMSVLVSETYIKEIDISKIEVGDSVEVLIDALPDKKYGGTIAQIANIGQEISGYDT